ncbi:FAD/NAD(P)-binding protein [Streptacidiphilus rugosus]|uniref:FAD/NAD(P)-binding protein n=1 Tax=Streptacidiphilus rugosus TaxID=405783 RepID=UPI000564C355|nr:FAD/NAD(P)-binding protein [Streptacidiphilus rugosus]
MNHRTLIIGGGATAVSALTQLVRVPSVTSITTIDPRPAGLGHAFGVTDPQLLCNTSVDVTSLDPDGPSGLLRYLTERGWPVGPDDFVPRYLVGHYCREVYLRSRRDAERRGIAVDHRSARATAIRSRITGPGPDDREYTVELDDGSRVTGTEVLVCLGLDRPRVPELVREHLGRPSLLAQPYPADRLRSLPGDGRALVLGSKLSAVDAALVLCRRGVETVMASPSGRLPAVRTRLRRPERPFLDRRGWRRASPGSPHLDLGLTRLLVSAIRKAGGRLPLREQTSDALSARQRLDDELALAAAGRVPWQDVVAEVIDAVNEWTAPWDASLRAEVLGRYREVMSRYISSIPQRNARLLDEHMAAGRLRLAPGFPLEVRPEGAGWRVEWPDGRSERFTHLVCATGFQPPQVDLAGPGRYRIGAPVHGDTAPEITEDLRLRDAHRGGTERIWLLGAAAHQRTAIVNYLNAAAKHAKRVAAEIAAETPRARSAA